MLLPFLFKVSEGGEWEVATICRNFDVANCLEENVTKGVWGEAFEGEIEAVFIYSRASIGYG